jgi:hypothetical protein
MLLKNILGMVNLLSDWDRNSKYSFIIIKIGFENARAANNSNIII